MDGVRVLKYGWVGGDGVLPGLGGGSGGGPVRWYGGAEERLGSWHEADAALPRF